MNVKQKVTLWVGAGAFVLLVLPLALLLGAWTASVITKPSGHKPTPVVREQLPSYAIPVPPAAGVDMYREFGVEAPSSETRADLARLSTEELLASISTEELANWKRAERAGAVPGTTRSGRGLQELAAHLRAAREEQARLRQMGGVRFFDMTLDAYGTVRGRVENCSDRVLSGVIVDVGLYDTNGQYIDSCSGTYVDRWGSGLEPGRVASFDLKVGPMRFPSEWSWTCVEKPVFATDPLLGRVLVVVGATIVIVLLAAAAALHYENPERSKAFRARIWRAVRWDRARTGFEGDALMKKLSNGLVIAAGVLAALLMLYELTWWQGSGVAKVLVGFGLAIVLLAAGTFLRQDAGWARSSTSTPGSKTGLDQSGEADRNV